MGGADLFRAAYPSAQAAALYTQHPITRLALAELKALLDWRQGYAEKARSLEAFYAKHDLGNGTVRIEDFKAGLSLGGVKVSPSQVHSIRGAFGNADGTVRWQEVLEGLDNLGHRQGLSIIMTHKMGPTTARHLGYTEGNPVMRGYLHHVSRAHSGNGAFGDDDGAPGAGSGATVVGLKSLMRTSNIKPVVQPPSDAPKGTYNVTSIHTAAVTSRHKCTVSTSLRATTERVAAASLSAPDLATTLKEMDGEDTSCVTLDAFLTACARAGLTLRPDELDVLRQSGLLRRPYDASPELIDYGQLEISGL